MPFLTHKHKKSEAKVKHDQPAPSARNKAAFLVHGDKSPLTHGMAGEAGGGMTGAAVGGMPHGLKGR